MNNSNYDFWKMAYDMKAIDEGMLREAVLTKENPYGEITPEEFKVITGKEFYGTPVTPVEPNQSETTIKAE